MCWLYVICKFPYTTSNVKYILNIVLLRNSTRTRYIFWLRKIHQNSSCSLLSRSAVFLIPSAHRDTTTSLTRCMTPFPLVSLANQEKLYMPVRPIQGGFYVIPCRQTPIRTIKLYSMSSIFVSIQNPQSIVYFIWNILMAQIDWNKFKWHH